MKTYIISENMKFVSNPLGGILQYTCLSTDHTADFFNVNMSFQSINSCHKSLCKKTITWSMSDGSLLITGDSQNVTLSFRMAGPPFETRELILEGEEIDNFKNALISLSQNKNM
ncbi:MAG TPA: hypothetical protein PK360_15720 [bacterium]|nr:hypothetical protein [bacterium]